MSIFHDSKVNRKELREYRLSRIVEQLRKHDYAGIILYDPLNIRYATDTANMQVWTMHNKVRYAFVSVDKTIILFEFDRCESIHKGFDLISEIRPATGYLHIFGKVEQRLNQWADEIKDVVTKYCSGNSRIAVDKLDPAAAAALKKRQIEIMDGEEIMEHARSIKSADEIEAMMESIYVCELGMKKMEESLRPGMTETALWSILHQINIEHGGEWIETRLLASGEHTKPWFQECSNRIIREGDMVSFDTDLIGPNGYCADISRSWICGDTKPNNKQKYIYTVSHDQVNYNVNLIKPGMSSIEFFENAFVVPEDCQSISYGALLHGVGLCDEYPAVINPPDGVYDGDEFIFEPGMVLCVESLVGLDDWHECVKLEEQVLVTDNGTKKLSSYHYDESMLES